MLPSSSVVASGMSPARVYRGVRGSFGGRAAKAEEENGEKMSAIAYQDRLIKLPDGERSCAAPLVGRSWACPLSIVVVGGGRSTWHLRESSGVCQAS